VEKRKQDSSKFYVHVTRLFFSLSLHIIEIALLSRRTEGTRRAFYYSPIRNYRFFSLHSDDSIIYWSVHKVKLIQSVYRDHKEHSTTYSWSWKQLEHQQNNITLHNPFQRTSPLDTVNARLAGPSKSSLFRSRHLDHLELCISIWNWNLKIIFPSENKICTSSKYLNY